MIQDIFPACPLAFIPLVVCLCSDRLSCRAAGQLYCFGQNSASNKAFHCRKIAYRWFFGTSFRGMDEQKQWRHETMLVKNDES